MTKKEQISKFLQEWDGDGYTVQDVYIEKKCADLMAEGIVKLFSIPDVSSRNWAKMKEAVLNSLLNLHSVSQQRELLITFLMKVGDCYGMEKRENAEICVDEILSN